MLFMKQHSLGHCLHQLPLCQLRECSHSITLVAILTLGLILLFSWAACNLPDLIFSTLVHTRIMLCVYWYLKHLHAREARCCLPLIALLPHVCNTLCHFFTHQPQHGYPVTALVRFLLVHTFTSLDVSPTNVSIPPPPKKDLPVYGTPDPLMRHVHTHVYTCVYVRSVTLWYGPPTDPRIHGYGCGINGSQIHRSPYLDSYTSSSLAVKANSGRR